MKVLKLKDFSSSNLHVTPKELMQELVESQDVERATSALVILLDESRKESWDTMYYASRLTTSQMVALCMDIIRTVQDHMRGIIE